MLIFRVWATCGVSAIEKREDPGDELGTFPCDLLVINP